MSLSDIHNIPYPSSLNELKTNETAYIRLHEKYFYSLVHQLAGFAAEYCTRIVTRHDMGMVYTVEYFGFPDEIQRPLFERLCLSFNDQGERQPYCFNPFLALYAASYTNICYHGDGVAVTYHYGQVVSEDSIPVLPNRVSVLITFGKDNE